MRNSRIGGLALCLVLWHTGCSHPNAPQKADAANGKPAEFARQLEQLVAGKSDQILLEQETLTDALLQRIPPSAHVRVLQATHCRLDRQGFAQLATLTSLEHLVLGDARVDDQQFRSLADCQQLRVLNLPRAIITDESLRLAASLPRLQLLRLGSPNMTDAGLQALIQCPSLKFLHVIGAPITDAGLKHVADMSRLESFYIDESRITDAGVSLLLQQRPDLHLHLDQRHPDRSPQDH